MCSQTGVWEQGKRINGLCQLWRCICVFMYFLVPKLLLGYPLSLRASSFRSSEIDEVPFPMLVRIPHHNCEQSGALRICVPKLEFGNKEQLAKAVTSIKRY